MNREKNQDTIFPVDSALDERRSSTLQTSTGVHTLTLAPDGRIIDHITGEDREKFAAYLSRCKYGDRRAAAILANRILAVAEHDPAFLNFIREANEAHSPVLLASHGIYYITTASKLIRDNLAGRLNTFLAQNNLPGVSVDDPVDTNTSIEGYFTAHPDAKPIPRPHQLMPQDSMSSWSVIFVDDILVSDEEREGIRQTIVDQGKADRVFFLYGAQLETTGDPQAFEEEITNRHFTPSLDSLIPLLQDPRAFTPVYRLLKTIMHPDNFDALPEFFAQLPAESLLKLYEAATVGDFRQRYNGRYRESTFALQAVLFSRGYVDSRGIVFDTQRIIDASTEYPHATDHIFSHYINKKADITLDEARRYSAMKYGDPEATYYFAQLMFQGLMSHSDVHAAMEAGEEVILTSSAYGDVATAATNIADHVEALLVESGVKIKRIKIHRNGNFATSNLGQMSQQERQNELKARKLTLDEDEAALLEGKTLIVIDDLCATGSHEKAVQGVLMPTKLRKAIFAYNVKFGESLMVNEPDTEEWLNRVACMSPRDVLARLEADSAPDLLVNARLVKFLLSLKPENQYGMDKVTKIAHLNDFVQRADAGILLRIYQAAVSKDEYCYMQEYIEGFKILEAAIVQRGILDMEAMNRAHGRIVAYNVTVRDGHFVDALTGERRDDVVDAYSRMKFGSVEDIELFGKALADTFIRRVQTNDNGLRDWLEGIAQRSEYITLFVPGSRNVHSSSNFVLQEALERINIALALQNLPTIIMLPLGRLESNAANYAQLPEAERAARLGSTKTILPGQELFQYPVHVLFGDDVRITGATVDRVRQGAKAHKARSFSEMYALAIDPAVAQEHPAIENELNTYHIDGSLGADIRDILNQNGFRPVQRLVRLILHENNRDKVYQFLSDSIRDDSLVSLYIAITNNDYLKDKRYKDSGHIVRQVLTDKGLIDSNGHLL